MSDLITQTWANPLIAALIGMMVGWLLRGIFYRMRQQERDAAQYHALKKREQELSKSVQRTSESNKPDSAPVAEGLHTTENMRSIYEVEEIAGISKSYSEKLRDFGIVTTQQLLHKCCALEGRVEVAKHIGLEDFVVQKWASMADLMRISGIGSQLAELLVHAGIGSTQDLGKQEAGLFLNELTRLNKKRHCVDAPPPLTLLDIMVAEARSLPPKMKGL